MPSTEQKALNQMLDEVQDEATFIVFLDALMMDKVHSEHEWQNDTIELFLDCAHAWASASINGLPEYKKPDNVWKRCAEILYMGKIYE